MRFLDLATIRFELSANGILTVVNRKQMYGRDAAGNNGLPYGAPVDCDGRQLSIEETKQLRAFLNGEVEPSRERRTKTS